MLINAEREQEKCEEPIMKEQKRIIEYSSEGKLLVPE